MSSDRSQNIERRAMIVAGEASGDLHGSNLIKAATGLSSQLTFYGVGGDKMCSVGCDILFRSDDLSVMGVQEVIGALPRILQRFKQLKKCLQAVDKPDLLILIDFPDFNLRLAKVAKTCGIPVLYYISPKVWAWRSGRSKIIADRVDRLALIFPFEVEIFRNLGVKADYVGNPLLDEFVTNKPEGMLRSKLDLHPQSKVIGLFPGSRQSELKYIFDSLLETARLIYKEDPDVQFVLPVAASLPVDFFYDKLAGENLPVKVVEENIYEVATACDAVLTVSGTVTLQIALTKTPMAVVYKVAPLSYEIGKRLIRVNHVSLTNIVAGHEIVREFIQEKADPELMKTEVMQILNDSEYRHKMVKELESVCTKLGEPGCSQRVAEIAIDMLGMKSGCYHEG